MEDTTQQKYDNKGEQLTNLLQYICDLADSENIKNKNLWLENIPSNIFIKNIRHKYNVKNKKNTVKAIIGEYDDPSNQKQGLVEVDFSKGDNIIVYGNAKSGKETLLSTMIYDLMVNYTTLQIQMYILDFGTEALKIFKKSPYVGDILFMGQDEKIETFFEMIQKNIKERKQILSDYNGDYNLYISKGNNMPIIVIIVNNYEVFNENYEDKYDDMFLTLTREGVKCGIVFVVTASSTNAMRYRLTSNFNKKIALQLNDESDYYSIFDAARNKRPTQLFGRGLVSINNQIYEFQTAKICDDAEYNEHIEEIIKKLDSENEIKAIPVPTLPKKIEAQDMKEYLKDISKVPIGLVKKNLEVYMYDFTKKFMTVISTKNMIDAVEWLNCLLEEVKELKNTKVKVLDADKISDSKKEAYDNFVKEVNKDMKDKKTFNLYVIVRIDKFANEGAIDESEFSELLEKAKQSEKQSFIIIDNPELLEGHGYDEWYVNFIDKDSGIWIGNGMENQTLISLNLFTEKVDNNCGNSFGYVVDEGNPTLIKLIGIEEEGDENE